MGAGNVKAVFVHWGDLPGGPFRLLAYMALRTKDGDARPRFWAGREDLAFGLGRRLPSGEDEESAKVRNAGFKAVKSAMGVLTQSGAVRLVERARPGRSAVYELNLTPVRGTESVPHPPVDDLAEPVDNTVDNSPMGYEKRPPNGARFSYPTGHGFPPEWGTVSGGTGHGNRAPKEEKEEGGLKEGGDGEGFPASSPPEQPAAPTNHDHSPGNTFTYRAACEYLLTLTGDAQSAAERRALDELGPAVKREEILIRAAAIAHRAIHGATA